MMQKYKQKTENPIKARDNHHNLQSVALQSQPFYLVISVILPFNMAEIAV